jgi:hypothetical protein
MSNDRDRRLSRPERLEMLLHCVRGIELTANQQIILEWLSSYPDETVISMVNMLDRVRRAGGTDLPELFTESSPGISGPGFAASAEKRKVARTRTALTDLTNVDMREVEKRDGERGEEES